MAKRSPLMQKWKLQKAKARRSGYWGRGLMKGHPKGPFMKDLDVVAGNKHASSKRHGDMSRLFDMSIDVNWTRMAKRIGPELANAGKHAVYDLFFKPKEASVGDNNIDPKRAIFDEKEQLWMLNHDPRYRFLRFNFVYIEGGEDTMFNLSIHFQGNEYFLVEKRMDYIRRSSIYSNKDRMMDLFHLGRIQWAARVSIA